MARWTALASERRNVDLWRIESGGTAGCRGAILDAAWLRCGCCGRYVAERIPGARLVLLPGVDQHPWIGEVEPVHRALDEFIRAL
jgi:hypothetical protein